MFENKVPRRIIGPKREGVTGDWRKSHNEKLHNLYSSPNFSVVKPKKWMRWAGYVACMREKRNTAFWLGNTIEDLGIDGRILLKGRLKK